MNTWFQVKVSYQLQDDDGAVKKVTEPYLVDAVSYTEAESRTHEKIGEELPGEFTITEIRKTNFSEIVNGEWDLWYKCRVKFVLLDEDFTGHHGAELSVFLAQAGALHRPVDNEEELILIEGFLQIVDGPFLHGGHGGADGGMGRHGGGAFSGKDPSKVDRSAAYAARYVAKNIVAAGIADRFELQVSYAIGVVEPMGIFVDTYGTSRVDLTDGEIAKQVSQIFDMRPAAIEERLKLRQPMYSETAAYGHMGRTNQIVTKSFTTPGNETKTMEVELFTWEKLDYVDAVKSAFGI